MAQSSGQDDFITRLKDNGIDLVLRYNEDGSESGECRLLIVILIVMRISLTLPS